MRVLSPATNGNGTQPGNPPSARPAQPDESDNPFSKNDEDGAEIPF
jgi:hypothetical protein